MAVNMAMKIRLNETRGRISSPRTNKIVSYRSFDCMSYRAPEYPSWHAVDTINDDRTAPGFITAWHNHMGLDILSYVIEGLVEHRDSLHNHRVAGPGQIQHMSCGSGIWHTESNPGPHNNRYLQIWLRPAQRFLEPPKYTLITRPHEFSPITADLYHPQVTVWAGWLVQDRIIVNSYVLVLEGFIYANDTMLYEGDALDTEDDTVTVSVLSPAHVVMFQRIPLSGQ
jgi:redox-sensitive bicupin YhaK (pirin superfamily)